MKFKKRFLFLLILLIISCDLNETIEKFELDLIPVDSSTIIMINDLSKSIELINENKLIDNLFDKVELENRYDKIVITDHISRQTATMRTRLYRSAARAIGMPATVYVTMNPSPLSKPNSQSCSRKSSMIGCARIPISKRSTALRV